MSDKRSRIDLAVTRQDDHTNLVEPSFSGILSFARRRYTKCLDGVDVAVVGLPFDLATTSRPGARLGPRAIREASAMIAWDRLHGWEYDPFERVCVVDFGDIPVAQGNPERLPDDIHAAFAEIHGAGVKTLMLGGDHFATYPVLKSVAAHYDEPLSLVHFDAHSDTWAEDQQTLDHGTMFYHAAKQGLIDPSRSIQVGIRTHNPETHGFHVLTAEQTDAMGADSVVQFILEKTRGNNVYLTLDIDCLDPAFAPGTGTPVVGGLSTMALQRILRGLRGVPIAAADVVEVAPAYDHAQITALAGATLAMSMIGLLADCETPE
ncbi:MAG: agmatinase [Pseudomonadota bacterium]